MFEVIEIPGDPLPQARHRTFRQGIRSIQYDPQANAKRIIADSLKSQILEGRKLPLSLASVSVAIQFHVRIPTKDKKLTNAILWGLHRPIGKPDLDNYIKFILDACNGLLWKDDSQINHIAASRVFTNDNPKTVIYMQDEKVIDPKTLKIYNIISPDALAEMAHQMESIDILIRDRNLEAAAAILQEFADTFAPLLAKIKKL